jgi:hypothetical protein
MELTPVIAPDSSRLAPARAVIPVLFPVPPVIVRLSASKIAELLAAVRLKLTVSTLVFRTSETVAALILIPQR